MSFNELLNKYCPNGVSFKTLRDISQMQRGTSLTKKQANEGTVPVISGGKEPAFYCDTENREGETITVAGSGAGAGYVQYWNKPIFVGDAFSIKGKHDVSTKYLYYCLTNMQEAIYSTKKGGGVPHVHISDIDNFEIPVPPVDVQSKIVEILDCFSSLEAELEAELEKRKRQYVYYRDMLLNFSDRKDVDWLTVNDVFEMRNGYTPSKSNRQFWEGGTIPWFRMDDIRANGRILSDSILHITDKGVKGKGLFEANTFILATSATIGEHALLTTDSLANQRFTNLKIKETLIQKLDLKFVFYYFFVIDDFCKHHSNKSGFESVDMDALRKMPYPIPALEEQRRIVGVLDKFESLTESLSAGLPAEIIARRKQYEYYRDKLLTFKRKEETAP